MEEHRTYPHERFALRRLTAGTLTSQRESMCWSSLRFLETSGYLNGSLIPVSVDSTVLARNIQLIAESLARYMFNLADSGLVVVLLSSHY